MLPLEAWLRSAGRIAAMFLAGFAALRALAAAVLHPHTGPQPAPCPPAECAFHPHAPHGPGG